MMKSAWAGFCRLLEMIKFSHTIFALPFALTGMVLAAGGLPKLSVVLWIVAAMVGARTAGMTWNRIADVDIDAKNPRTKDRHLPAGKVGMGAAWALTLGGTALMLFAAHMLNPLCLKLAPVALFAFFVYPYAKRFTNACHFILGICLGGAPLGAYIAVTGEIDPRILPLALAVMLWVAGFDVLYALQDLAFDKEAGLHSVPNRIGVYWSLMLARGLHLAMMLLLAWLSPLFGLGYFYAVGLVVVAGLIIYEHSLLSPKDLSKLDAAFFTMNGIISVVVFSFTFLDLLILK